jgi:mannose-6-phosphate isomerase
LALRSATLRDLAPFRWVLRLQHEYPHDPAVLAPLFLHHLVLEPGQALYTPPGVLHSYLGGLAIELMRSSDNVLRAGLTRKQIARQAVLETANFSPRRPQPIVPRSTRHAARVTDGKLFTGESEAFELLILELSPDTPVLRDVRSLEILLCVTGRMGVRRAMKSEHSSSLTESNPELLVVAGRSVFIPAATGAVELVGEGMVAIATVPA